MPICVCSRACRVESSPDAILGVITHRGRASVESIITALSSGGHATASGGVDVASIDLVLQALCASFVIFEVEPGPPVYYASL